MWRDSANGAAVDADNLPGEILGSGRSQPHGRRSDVFRCAPTPKRRFPLDPFLRASGLTVREIRPSNLFGYWRLLRCINEKPASTLP